MLLEEARNLLKEVQMSLWKELENASRRGRKALERSEKKLWERLGYVSIHTF